MKVNFKFLAAVLFASLLLNACGEKEAEAPVVAPAPVVAEPAPAPKVEEPGGYVPTPEERVPGEIRPVDSAPVDPEAPPATEVKPTTPESM